nr:NADPH-dependent codeinone reductase 2-like protein [Fagopyrum tataricum]
MSSNNIPSLPLNSGNAIPVLGFGTATDPLVPDELKQAVLKAIKLGYRHFDSAANYQSEKPLGEAIKEALKLGLIESRDQLFVTSKLWTSDAHSGLVVPALQNSLRNLGLEYLDLYLIHWPISSTPGNYELMINKEELMPMNFEAVWKDMEECQKLGLTKSIGVSNFSCKKLQILLDVGTIPPAVNQVEMNPFWQQKKLREFCKEKEIHISAFSPLGAYNTSWGTSRVMECDTLKQIAEGKGKTIAQVCL